MNTKDKIKQRLPNVDSEDIDELSNEQADFIVHPLEQSCFLSACPGSGKTQVVGIKTAYEITDWKKKYSGIAVLSFTKRAAKEIADRVTKYDGINAAKHPHFIGTIDSWLHSYILHPYGHTVKGFTGREGDKSYFLVDNTERGERYAYLSSFETEHHTDDKKPNPIQVNNFYFTFEGKPEHLKMDFLNFSPQKVNNLTINKSNFLKAGLCTYQDAEYLCYQVLKQNDNFLQSLSKRFSAIIIDECQDLSQSQIRLFHLLKEKGTHIHFIGDVNQAIYDFRKVYVDKLLAFIEHQNIEKKFLSDNYRSNQKIVDVCGRIIEKLSNEGMLTNTIIGKKELIHEDCILLWKYDNDIQDLPTKFISLLTERGIEVSKSVVIGRSHSLLNKIRPDTNSGFNKIELFANALSCWNIPNRTGKDMQNALQQMGKSISNLAYKGKGNSQQQYCPEKISPIDWRMILFDLIKTATEYEIHNFEEKTWSEWAGEVKNFLENYYNKLPKGKEEWHSVKSKIRGSTTDKIVSKVKNNSSDDSAKIRVSTIHGVKGETFDAVLLVSAKDKKSKGGHVEQWIGLVEEAKDEHIRFAYVASSRPKHLLVWAIPQNNTQIFETVNAVLGLNQNDLQQLLPENCS